MACKVVRVVVRSQIGLSSPGHGAGQPSVDGPSLAGKSAVNLHHSGIP